MSGDSQKLDWLAGTKRPLETADFGTRVLGFRRIDDFDRIQERTAQMLARALNTGRVVGFVGSGLVRAFGYPKWEELVENAVREAQEKHSKPQNSRSRVSLDANDSTLQLLRLFQELLAKNENPSVIDLERRLRLGERSAINVQALGECSRLLGRKQFREGIARRFNAIEQDDELKKIARVVRDDLDLNPLAVTIRELGITRFLTLNYDYEIERALKMVRGFTVVEETGQPLSNLEDTVNYWGKQPTARSMRVDPKNPDTLALFAVGAPGYEHGVFHCHGVAAHPDTMIVTERDYQRIYLRGDRESEAYRESLELAFSGNAVLFMGVGMDEPDVLRALRHYVSEQSTDEERDLFVVLSRRGSRAEDEYRRRQLYASYGVKALFHDRVPPGTPENRKDAERNRAFCEFVRKIAQYRNRWWVGWQTQPTLRAPAARSSDARRSGLRQQVRSSVMEAGNAVEGSVIEFLTDSERRKSGALFVITGASGAGKGAVCERIANLPEHLDFRKSYDATYFASATFSNDFLSILEDAAAFFQAPSGPRESSEYLLPEERFAEALAAKGRRNLFILSGLERLLVARDYPAVGTGAAAEEPAIDHLGRPWVPPERRVAINVGGRRIQFGRPLTTSIRDFLHNLQLAVMRGHCHVILATSLWPESIVWPSEDPGRFEQLVRIVSEGTGSGRNQGAGSPLAEGIASTPESNPDGTTSAIGRRFRAESFERLDGDSLAPFIRGPGPSAKGLDLTVDDLAHVLRGHAHAMAIAKHLLAKAKARGVDERAWIQDVYAEVTARADHRRPLYLVEKAIEELDGKALATFEEKALARDVLFRICVFSAPIGVAELVATFDADAVSPSSARSEMQIAETCEALVSSALLESVKQGSDAQIQYAAPSLVRQYHVPPGETQRFVLPGFSEQGDVTLPYSRELDKAANEWLDRLLLAAEEIQAVQIPTGDAGDVRRERLSRIARAAFVLVRARWTAIGLARHPEPQIQPSDSPPVPHYQAYLTRLSRLGNLIKRTQIRSTPDAGVEDGWLYRRRLPRDQVESQKGILYADEMAWIVNEMALVSYQQGVLHDAHSLFRSGKHLHAIAERGTAGRRYCQSAMNLGVVEIERGRIENAKKHLLEGLAVAQSRDDEEMTARIKGYLGWIAHLGVDIETARKLYDEALRTLSQGDNYRGMAIFYRLRGDLHRLQGEHVACERDLQQSISTAQLGDHPDLVHYSRLSRCMADLKRLENGMRATSAADAAVRAATGYARFMGLPRMEAEAAGMMARLALQDGDLETAGRHARHMLALAKENALGLRVTSGLVLLGNLAFERGERESARGVYQSALELGRRQAYYLQVEEAQKGLFRLLRG